MDLRYKIFKERLNSFTNEEICRILDNINMVCYDTFNYNKNNKKYCPLALAMNLHKTVSDPTDEKITEEIRKRFSPPNALKSVDGEFYKSNRETDLLFICTEIINERLFNGQLDQNVVTSVHE